MRRIVIPDIHEYSDRVVAILAHERYDEAIFLGDWVDRFKTQPGNLTLTLDLLLSLLKDPKNVFLYGNHDLPYAFPSIYGLGCSGHQWERQDEIEAVFSVRRVRKRFKLYYEADGYLFSHAGLAGYHATLGWRERADTAIACLTEGGMSPWVAAGIARGGNLPKGGLTWLDWSSEFESVDGLKQVVGHTKGKSPRRKGDNFCIDTGLDHYGILEDGVFTVYDFNGKEYQWDE